MPPIEMPQKFARLIDSASIRPITSSVRLSNEYLPAGASVPPWPRWS